MRSLETTLVRGLYMSVAVLALGAMLLALRVVTGERLEHWRLAMLLMVLIIGLASPVPRPPVACGRTRNQIAMIDALLLGVVTMGCTDLAFFWITDQVPAAFLIGLVAASALMAGILVPVALRKMVGPKVLLIHGANAFGIEIARQFAAYPNDVKIVGFLDDGACNAPPGALPLPIMGRLCDLPARLPDDEELDGVIVALPNVTPDELRNLRRGLRQKSLAMFVVSPVAATGPSMVAGAHIGPLHGHVVGVRGLNWMEQWIKRAVDVVLATAALIILAPVLIICAIIIKLESKGPVIFRQPRFTTQNRLFECYKLRTMIMSRPGETGIVLTQRNDRRVTRFGAFLRATSLDEVPQFVNVLQGHMSVVGPRPHPPGVKAGDRIYEDVIADFSERYVVKPGITGWAQVSGLRGNTFDEGMLVRRFNHDLEYIQHWSLSFEMLIILKTMLGGLGGRNAF